MIAKNGHGMRADGPCRHMQHARKPLTGDAVHQGQHQHQALRGSEADRQAARLQSAVHGTGRACLGLHLDQLYPLTKQVLFPVGGPDIGFDCHRGRRRNRIDRSNFGKSIRHIGAGFVTVYSHIFSGFI